MSEYIIQGETLTSIAEAIRAKTGITESLTPQEMIIAIQNSGGSDNEMLKGMISRQATEIIVPEGTECIGANAFSQYTNLKQVVLPDGLVNIEYSAFIGCTNLKLVSLPESLEQITNSAFSGCTSLELTVLPEKLKHIGQGAFNGCRGLKTITFEGKPESIYPQAFGGCTNLTTIKVPWAEGEVANAPWSATNATIIYNWDPIFEESITFGAYDEDLVGHTTLIETNTVLNFENETSYKVFVNDVEYEGYGWKDEWTTGVEVNMGDMMLAIAQDIESGIMNADYLYMESPESTEDLPESLTLDVVILKN